MVSLLQLFWVFAKIGAFTIGGGLAMLPLIQSEIVRRGWLKEEDFPDIIALAQSAPGIFAVNIAIFTGYRLRGVKGGLVASLGSVLPSFLIILIIAIAFSGYKDNPTVIKIFKGIRPVTVALIAAPMIQMACKSKGKWWSWLIMGTSLGLVAFLKISPIYILLTVVIFATAIAWWNGRRQKEGRK